jgi:hypothetical protein
MNLYDGLATPSCVLNEQVARQIFDTIGEDSLVVLIVDLDGHHWPSDSQAYAKLQIDDSLLNDIRGRINDGFEPVIVRQKNYTIVAAELATERTRCGYVALLLPNKQSETSQTEIGLLEILISQINLVAKLIEKNILLYELQNRNTPGTSSYVQREPALN